MEELAAAPVFDQAGLHPLLTLTNLHVKASVINWIRGKGYFIHPTKLTFSIQTLGLTCLHTNLLL
jgi:hypothetical protein